MARSIKVTRLTGNTFSISTSRDSLDLESSLQTLFEKYRSDLKDDKLQIEDESRTIAPKS